MESPMTTISTGEATLPVQHADRFFIGGQWVTPSSDSTITVIDSHTEEDYLTVAEAQAPDMDRAIAAAKEAFDHGPWPRLSHAERATYLRALGDEVVKRSAPIQQMWPREAGVLAGQLQPHIPVPMPPARRQPQAPAPVLPPRHRIGAPARRNTDPSLAITTTFPTGPVLWSCLQHARRE
jgi:hypothetical protein